MGPVSCQPLCPGPVLSSASWGRHGRPGPSGLAVQEEPAEPNEVLAGAEFPTCGKQVQEVPKGAQGWAQRGCLFPTLPMASEGSGSLGGAKEVCSARHIPREEEDLKEKNCTSDPGETVPLQRTTKWLSGAALSYLTDSGGGHLGGGSSRWDLGPQLPRFGPAPSWVMGTALLDARAFDPGSRDHERGQPLPQPSSSLCSTSHRLFAPPPSHTSSNVQKVTKCL